MVGTWVVVVEIVMHWSRMFRRIGTRIAFVSLLHITLGMSRIDSEKSFASSFLLFGDIACSQSSIVEGSHAVISVGVEIWWVEVRRVVATTVIVT